MISVDESAKLPFVWDDTTVDVYEIDVVSQSLSDYIWSDIIEFINNVNNDDIEDVDILEILDKIFEYQMS